MAREETNFGLDVYLTSGYWLSNFETMTLKKPGRVRWTVRLPQDLARQVRLLAAKDIRNVNDEIVAILNKEVEQRKEELA